MCVYVYKYLCERWVWARMRLHRLACTRACDCAHNMYIYTCVLYIYVYIYIYVYVLCMYMYVYKYLCERWVWARMRLHRLACTRACDWLAPPMRPSPSRARVGTSARYI